MGPSPLVLLEVRGLRGGVEERVLGPRRELDVVVTPPGNILNIRSWSNTTLGTGEMSDVGRDEVMMSNELQPQPITSQFSSLTPKSNPETRTGFSIKFKSRNIQGNFLKRLVFLNEFTN